MNNGVYVTQNNTYGKNLANSLPYSQSIYVVRSEANWVGNIEWSWPLGAGGIKSYPNILVGSNPWAPLPTTVNWLPMILSNLPAISAEVDLQTEVSVDSVFDTTFDLWITSSLIGNVVAEVMILINQKDIIETVEQYKVGTFVIDGAAYDFCTPANDWTLLVFVRAETLNTGTIAIDQFIRFLVDNGYLSNSLYLASIAFGHEVINGTGKTTVNNYKITAQ